MSGFMFILLGFCALGLGFAIGWRACEINYGIGVTDD